jgi:uncharacterized protein (DUF4415 family)
MAFTSFLVAMENAMKSENISKKVVFSPEFIAAAPEDPVYDPENPPMAPGEFDNAIVSHSYVELKAKLAEYRRRGPQKTPKKQATSIRFDEDVLSALKATGKDWQTRVNDVMREWVETHV